MDATARGNQRHQLLVSMSFRPFFLVSDLVLQSSACTAELCRSIEYTFSSSGRLQFCILPRFLVPRPCAYREGRTSEDDDVGRSWAMRLLHLHSGASLSNQ